MRTVYTTTVLCLMLAALWAGVSSDIATQWQIPGVWLILLWSLFAYQLLIWHDLPGTMCTIAPRTRHTLHCVMIVSCALVGVLAWISLPQDKWLGVGAFLALILIREHASGFLYWKEQSFQCKQRNTHRQSTMDRIDPLISSVCPLYTPDMQVTSNLPCYSHDASSLSEPCGGDQESK